MDPHLWGFHSVCFTEEQSGLTLNSLALRLTFPLAFPLPGILCLFPELKAVACQAEGSGNWCKLGGERARVAAGQHEACPGAPALQLRVGPAIFNTQERVVAQFSDLPTKTFGALGVASCVAEPAVSRWSWRAVARGCCGPL